MQITCNHCGQVFMVSGSGCWLCPTCHQQVVVPAQQGVTPPGTAAAAGNDDSSKKVIAIVVCVVIGIILYCIGDYISSIAD